MIKMTLILYRGIVSGVQTGLQSLMDLVKFGLVIALPHPDKFGLLIILSFMVILSVVTMKPKSKVHSSYPMVIPTFYEQ